MSERRKTTTSGFVAKRTGTEGPTFDPYSFTEWTVKRGRSMMKLHLGALATWLEIPARGIRPRKRIEPANSRRTTYEKAERALIARFEKFARVELRHLEKAMDRRKRCCAKPRLDWQSGYPGESFLICRSCGAFVDSTFNRSAVE